MRNLFAVLVTAMVILGCVSAPATRNNVASARDGPGPAPDPAPVASPSPAQVATVVSTQGAAVVSSTTPMRPAPERAVLADTRFEPWLRKVAEHGGWEGKLKANPGRTRIHGIFCTRTVMVVALPHQSMTVDGHPLIDQAYLEFEHAPMQRWSSPPTCAGVDLSGIDLWMYSGQGLPERFTFSFQFQPSPEPVDTPTGTIKAAPSTGWG